MFKDAASRHGMAIGGVSVIIAILLIFFYLLYVVIPLFRPAQAEAVADYAPPGGGRTVHLAMEEQAEIGARFTAEGRVAFFDTRDGRIVQEHALQLPADTQITSFAAGDPTRGVVAFGLSDGRAVVLRHHYTVTYPQDVRLITPEVEYPLGEAPVVVDDAGQALQGLAVQGSGEEVTLVAATADHRLLLTHFARRTSFLDDAVTIERGAVELPFVQHSADFIGLNVEQRDLYVVDRDGTLVYFDVRDKTAPRLLQNLRVTDASATVTAITFLSGGISLMIADSGGRIAQWFPVRDARNQYSLNLVREFRGQDAGVRDIAGEYTRKGFVVGDGAGRVGVYYATSHRTLMVEQVAEGALQRVAIAPRADALLAEDERGRLHFWRIENEHPEISWSALWGKVWYESYPEPAFVWQSSAANNEFEPKLSLTPLAFGTLKAAFYAMLIAMPLAIMGAIFTAYFMAPAMRRKVKPTIEIMEALPTVILGFLAGLWLAPLVENNLPGIFSMLLIMPPAILLFGYVWNHLPFDWRHRVPDGWQAALLVPVVLLVIGGSMMASQPLERWLFDGDMRSWLSTELGIGFDQRNTLVVGLAMGFAVIPPIFSIAEDAIFNVPRHLTNGSLALGATPWQTLVRVVLLTASPGIFSALMIGLGRAVGETMIVLMATGNTPVMDFSMFSGLRALSANIAVEMPEAEVDSTHYRVLFLAALVLFMFTFLVNTVAEIVRQRLRRKYSSL